MKEGIAILGVVLLVAAIVLVAAGTAGAAIGLFFGALLWVVERVAGPLSEPVDGEFLWFTLAALALVLAADLAWGLRRRRGSATPSRGPSGASPGRVG